MKKLSLLSSLVDLFWITNLIGVPGLFILVILSFTGSGIDIPININGTEIPLDILKNKLILAFVSLSYFGILYSIYMFKKCCAILKISKYLMLK